MTRLRKMMLEELQRRNFSEDTIRRYIHTVEDFARHFNSLPDRLGLRHIREYQAHLFQKRKLSSVPLPTTWRLCAFSTSGRSRKPGASPRPPIRKRTITFQRSSARKKSHGSSMLLRLPSIALCS
jgi:Phage integrase, N-terminal SAM-like domain